MLSLGLSVSQQAVFHRLLLDHHTIDIRLQLLDLNHKHLADLSANLVDGQVTVDADAQVTRALDLELLDATGGIQLDADSPNDSSLFADKMVRVVYRVVNPAGTAAYPVPVFTGPVTKLDRSGVLLSVECQGKEIFGLSEPWRDKTFKKGTRVTAAIRYIVGEMMGELDAYMDIPNRKAKLPKNVSVGGDGDLPWVVAQRLAASIGCQLYYDGNGVCRLRKRPVKTPVWTFREDESVKTAPDVGFSNDKLVNAVEVWGKKPNKGQRKKGKKRPHARVVAPRNHPLSPWKLGRKGGPRYFVKTIEDDKIENDAEAKRRARTELDRGLIESVEVAYDTFVIPHLEELDIVGLNTSAFSTKHQARQFAIGLTAAGDSSMGYVRNVKPNHRSNRHRRKSRTTNRRKRR